MNAPMEEFEFRRPDGDWNCPIHGQVEGRNVIQVGMAGESADWRCFKCYRENIIIPNCQSVTIIPPP